MEAMIMADDLEEEIDNSMIQKIVVTPEEILEDTETLEKLIKILEGPPDDER